MGKDTRIDIDAVNETLREAFTETNRWLRSRGGALLKAKPKVISYGPNKGVAVYGASPSSGHYKVTNWLKPWELVDLLRLCARRGVSSPTRMLKILVSEALPAKLHAARPAVVKKKQTYEYKIAAANGRHLKAVA